MDFDATLAHYEKWTDLLELGEPVWPMVERVRQWLREGKDVRVFTARICPPYVCAKAHVEYTREDVERAIQDWTEEHIGARLPVTCIKDRFMLELWDDRCVQVEPNTGEPVTYWQSRVD